MERLGHAGILRLLPTVDLKKKPLGVFFCEGDFLGVGECSRKTHRIEVKQPCRERFKPRRVDRGKGFVEFAGRKRRCGRLGAFEKVGAKDL